MPQHEQILELADTSCPLLYLSILFSQKCPTHVQLPCSPALPPKKNAVRADRVGRAGHRFAGAGKEPQHVWLSLSLCHQLVWRQGAAKPKAFP